MNAQPHIKAGVPVALVEQLEAAREIAMQAGLPVRRSDADLYSLLAKCLGICEYVEANNCFEELRTTLAAHVPANGRGRVYVEKRAHPTVLVCRYVLEGRDSRNSFYRYAASLKEAQRRGIRSENLPAWLSENGGVNTLYRGRPVKSKQVGTSVLHLNSRVIAPKKGTQFCVTLEEDGRGFFNVISVEGGRG